MNEVFLCPRLTGPRFEGGMIPLEFLKDFAVLEEMIVEIAKCQFLSENPERKRTPRGFTDRIAMKLTKVSAGSAIPEISLCVASEHPMMFNTGQTEQYLERARDSIVRAIAAAERGQPITDHIPEKALAYFDRFGRSLRDQEAIEFVGDTEETLARLTKATRRKLVLASARVNDIAEETSVRGSIPAADQHKMTFKLQTNSRQEVAGPISPQHYDTIMDAFVGFKSGTRVQLQGIGRFDRKGRLRSLDSVAQITVLDPRDVPARLDEIRTLDDGWLDGSGIAPRSEWLDWLSDKFNQLFPDDLPLPLMFPTPIGGIQAEWDIGAWQISLEIDLGSRSAEWHALNIEGGEENPNQLNLDNIAHWKWIAEEISRLSKGSE